jgi:hypothetical protein
MDRRRRVALVLGMVGVASIGGCDSPTDAGPQLRINGTVRETGSGQPIAGAEVTLWGSSTPPAGAGTEALGRALSDPRGRYLLAVSPPDPGLCPYLNLWATKSGYSTSTWSNFANPALDPIRCTAGVQTLDFELLLLP